MYVVFVHISVCIVFVLIDSYMCLYGCHYCCNFMLKSFLFVSYVHIAHSVLCVFAGDDNLLEGFITYLMIGAI